MFEAAELGRKILKREFERRLPELRARLVQAEFALKQAKIPVIIIISDVDGAGKGDVVHRLNEWLDPRGLDIHAFWHEREEEREHPPLLALLAGPARARAHRAALRFVVHRTGDAARLRADQGR